MDAHQNKTCTRCQQTKPTTEFSPNGGNHFKSRCKRCCADLQQARNLADPDKARARRKQSYWKDVDRNRAKMRERSRKPEFRRRAVIYNQLNPQYKQKYANKLRSDVITHYGGKCVHCGESRAEFLVLDHINDDGAEHRRTIPGAGGGNTFYRKIRMLGYPPGLQVLCANCNWRKERLRRSGAETAQTRYYARVRDKIFAHYGGVCACCGVAEEAVLTLDHIHNDGAVHRLELTGSTKGAGVVFYRQLIRLGFPSGLQTLCWNCNTARARFKTCPHQQLRQP